MPGIFTSVRSLLVEAGGSTETDGCLLSAMLLPGTGGTAESPVMTFGTIRAGDEETEGGPDGSSLVKDAVEEPAEFEVRIDRFRHYEAETDRDLPVPD